MKFTVVLLACACIFLAILPSGNAQQPSSAIRNISYSEAEDGTERVEIAVNNATTPGIFMIEGDTPRLVLDFAGSTFTGRPPAAKNGGGLVQGIRVGIHAVPKRKTRVVIDLAAGRDIKWTQDFLVSKNLLVISFTDRKRKAPPVSVATPAPAPAPSTPTAPAVPTTATAPAPAQPSASAPLVITRGYSKIKVLPTPVPAVAQQSDSKPDSKPDPKPQPATARATSVPVVDAAGEQKVVAGDEQPQPAPVLLEVSFDNEYTRSGEMVLLKLNDFQPPEISAEEKDPPRVYCDFAGARIGDGIKDVQVAGGKYVEKIRVLKTDEPAGVRVALDLAVGNNYDLQQVFFKEDNLFVLIVNILEQE